MHVLVIIPTSHYYVPLIRRNHMGSACQCTDRDGTRAAHKKSQKKHKHHQAHCLISQISTSPAPPSPAGFCTIETAHRRSSSVTALPTPTFCLSCHLTYVVCAFDGKNNCLALACICSTHGHYRTAQHRLHCGRLYNAESYYRAECPSSCF